MKLITKEIETKLSKNTGNALVDKPYLKLFSPVGSATWLITEYNKETDELFGLCDLGHGSPEIGYVSLKELQSMKIEPFGLSIERDKYWEPDRTLSEYNWEAKKVGSILGVI